jgi:hypothetical protein
MVPDGYEVAGNVCGAAVPVHPLDVGVVLTEAMRLSRWNHGSPSRLNRDCRLAAGLSVTVTVWPIG